MTNPERAELQALVEQLEGGPSYIDTDETAARLRGILNRHAPEPDEGRWVEVRLCVAAVGPGDWHFGDDERRAARFYDRGERYRLSWVTARVPLPEEPTEVVGEVSDG